MSPNRRSLTQQASLSALAVVVGPLALVLIFNAIEAFRAHHISVQLASVSVSVEAALRDHARELDAAHSQVQQIAAQSGVLVRVLGRDGRTVVEADQWKASSVTTALGDLFYGSARGTALDAWERKQSAISTRVEIAQAWLDGGASRCEPLIDANTLLCLSSRKVHLMPEDLVIHVQASTRQSFAPLWQSPGRLVALLLLGVLVALGFRWWLVRRWVEPIETAARQLSGLTNAAAGPNAIDDLTGAVDELTRTMKSRALESEAALSGLVKEVSTMLATVRTAAQRLAPTEATALAPVLTENLARLERISSELAALSQLEAGHSSEPRVAFDVSSLLGNLIEALKADARFRGVELEAHLSAVPVLMTGVQSAMQTALWNVLQLAASRAGDEGIVRVQLNVEEQQLSITVNDSGDMAALTPEAAERVFDRFSAHGGGLAMAITKAIVTQHGGTASASAPAGSRLEVTLTLPRSRSV